MDLFVRLGALASIITAMIAIISIYPIFRSLKQSERSLRFNVYNQVVEKMERTRKARHLLYTKVPETPSTTSLNLLSPDEIEQLDDLTRSFDEIGLLIKYGVVPLGFVLDFYSHPIVIAWHRLEPSIMAERSKRNQPFHMYHFEQLAREAKKYRDKEQPGGETFHISTLVNPTWHIWRK